MQTEYTDSMRLIPQRPPMVMIGGLIAAGEGHAVTRTHVAASNIFVANGFFSEPGLVENIAQTAAAMVGYACEQKNIPVPVGYIAAVKDLKIAALPAVDSVISTTVRVVHTVANVNVVQGTVMLDGQVICSCEMKIFIKSD